MRPSQNRVFNCHTPKGIELLTTLRLGLTEVFLYSKEDLGNINNTSILGAIIQYLIETKIFNAQLF